MTEGSENWAAYFRQIREEAATGAAFNIPPVKQTVLRRSLPPAGAEPFLGASVRKALKAPRDAGWQRVELGFSLVQVSNEYRLADSVKKPGQEAPEHRKGDLKKPAHFLRYWWVLAVEPSANVAFRAGWKEGVTAAGRRGFTFESALVTDPIGLPREHFVDYAPDANALKQIKDEPAWAHQQRAARLIREATERDLRYNDGKSWQNIRPVITSGTEFTVWLGEAVKLVRLIRGEGDGT
ncbi:MAG: hypothetical protein K0Q52_141 [Microbacterium sp.]|jgi:hypothetical protein|nr:hypothetical protein [Microbacterium sp.]